MNELHAERERTEEDKAHALVERAVQDARHARDAMRGMRAIIEDGRGSIYDQAWLIVQAERERVAWLVAVIGLLRWTRT